MHLPFVEALRTKVIGQSPAPYVSWAHVDYSDMKSDRSAVAEHLLDYRSSAEVFFQQTAPKDAGDMVREKAVRAMAHHVYGPIENELRGVLEHLWENGMHHSVAAKKIEAMLPTLRGEK